MEGTQGPVSAGSHAELGGWNWTGQMMTTRAFLLGKVVVVTPGLA